MLEKLTIKDAVEFYLREFIEDRVVDGKTIEGSRKIKGQKEVRRTLYNGAVKVLGDRIAE